MLFNSIAFFLFFPVVCLVYFLLPTVKLRNIWLLLSSYYFYMNWEPTYALLLFSCTVITYGAGYALEYFSGASLRKWILGVSLTANFSILVFFKYFNFIASNLTELLVSLGLSLPTPKLTFLLPMGISFYTFQAVSYSIDVYRGGMRAEKNFFYYALFVSFFPQLVAGPIERSTHLLPQFRKRHSFCPERIFEGARLMLWGFFLKLALADGAASYVDAVFNNVAGHSGSSYILAAFFFTFQIYGDFAGYSLVALGAAKVMGFELMENFHRPYWSASIGEFWRRWHISLSIWFRDYLYFPLGGNRRGRIRTHLNLMLTFLVSGLWHGANWTYVFWGGIHGVFEVLERMLGWHNRDWTGVRRWLHIGVTFMLVSFAWVFFRVNTIGDALTILTGMMTDALHFPYLPISPGLMFLLNLAILGFKELKDELKWPVAFLHSSRLWVRYASFTLLTLYILLFGVLNGGQFLYFQF